MFAYIFTLGAVESLSVFREIANKKGKAFFEFSIFIVLFCLMGFRYGVGQDYFFTYVPIFQEVLLTGTVSNVEWGYIFLNRICSIITKDYALIFLLTAFIFVSFIIFACKYYDSSWVLMITIFVAGGYYLYSFNVMRQSIVIAMFFFSLRFIDEKKPFLYFLVNGIGACIHITGLLYLPLYFILNRKYKTIVYFFMVFIFLVLRISINPILSFLLINTKYYNYLTGYYFDSSSQKLTASQILNIIGFFLYFFGRNKKYNDPKFNIFMNVQFIGLLFSIFVGVVPLISRITTMFYLVQFLSFPYLIRHYYSQTAKTLFSITGVVLSLMLFGNTLIQNGNNIIPYHTIFSR